MEPGPSFNLPEGWRAAFDKGQNRYYFWNIHTHERTWYKPTVDGNGMQKAGSPNGLRNGSSSSIGSDGSTNGLSSPLSSSCVISGTESSSPTSPGMRYAVDPPSSPAGLDSLRLNSPRPRQDTETFCMNMVAMDEDKESSFSSTTNKRQRATTETMTDAPSSGTGGNDNNVTVAPSELSSSSIATTSSTSSSRSLRSTLATTGGSSSSLSSSLFAWGASGTSATSSAGTRTKSPTSEELSSSNPGRSPLRKSKLKDFMSMIGKKTSFSREKKRRENVMAERSASIEPSSLRDTPAAIYPKSAQTRSLLTDILKGQYVFQGLSNDELLKVVDMMCKEEVQAGHILIQQGDRGDYFYVVESGSFDVFQTQTEGETPKAVGNIASGGSFGELALIYTQARAASVRAVTNAVVWKLDRSGFRSMLRSSAKHDIQEAKTALRSVPLLSVLTDEQIEGCSNVVRFREFKKGEQIIRKGEIGDVFYIIKNGEVEVSGGVALKMGESPPVLRLGPHAFFGERALLKDEARAANVVAMTEVTCLVLDRYAFTTILGPLREVLDNNIRMTVFKQIELFKHLDDSEVSKIFKEFTIQSFEPGDYIIKQGEQASSFYVLRSGEAKVTQRVVFRSNGQEVTNTVSTLQIGDYFGEIALLENGFREANVIATSPCECFVLDRCSFEGLLGPADAILKRDMQKRRQANVLKHKEIQRQHILQHHRQQQYQEQQRMMQEQHAEAMEVDPTQSAKRTNFKMEEFLSFKTLGTGTFGRVQLVKHRFTGETFALKVQSKAQVVKFKLQQNIINEKLILATLNHPFIITLHQTFQDRDCLYMLLELVQGGELFSFLQNYGANLQKSHHIFYVANVVSSFAYLHSKQILYRDLKPENILIDLAGYLKLVDFGFAKLSRGKTFTLCGTPEFFSPELVLGRGYGSQNDVWGLGILMFEIINGYTPFGGPDDNSNEVCKRIVKQPLVFPEDCVDQLAKELMAALLRKDPLKRIGGGRLGITDIMNHQWFSLVNWDDLQNKRIQAPWRPPVKDATDGSLFDDYDENFRPIPYLETGPAAAWTNDF